MDNSGTYDIHSVRELAKRLAAVRMHLSTMLPNEKLTRSAIENCKSETVRQWLKENLGSSAFCKLADMFNFLKRHIDEEEGKPHSGHIHIVFIAHGAIRGSLVPARCLLPLTTITDVLLYNPWNCTMSSMAVAGVATGCMKPKDRIFHSRTTDGLTVPSEKHHSKNFPDHWNSMKEAGDLKIPTIMLSPMKPSAGLDWKKISQPDRNRIIIPYIDPESAESVPFFIVTLALSLVLLSSRFQATVHLASCLSDHSTGKKFDQDYLRKQYACTDDNTMMTFSPDKMTRPVFETMFKKIQQLFG